MIRLPHVEIKSTQTLKTCRNKQLFVTENGVIANITPFLFYNLILFLSDICSSRAVILTVR